MGKYNDLSFTAYLILSVVPMALKEETVAFFPGLMSWATVLHPFGIQLKSKETSPVSLFGLSPDEIP
jgi:hypothetical protein